MGATWRAAIVGAALVVVTGCASQVGHNSASAATAATADPRPEAGPAALTRTPDAALTTDGSVVVLRDGERFLPLIKPVGQHLLTSDQAWHAFTVTLGSPQDSPPPQMHAAFGILTFQRWDDAPVYAFTEDSGCLYTGPMPVPGRPTPTLNRPTRCVEWTFLDALTGEQIESTWEPIRAATGSTPVP